MKKIFFLIVVCFLTIASIPSDWKETFDFSNDSVQWDVVHVSLQKINDSTYTPGKYLVSIDIQKPELVFNHREYKYWEKLLNDSTKNLGANIFLYYYFEKDADTYIDFKREDWKGQFRDFEVLYWKTYLKERCSIGK